MLRHACGYALANKGHDTRSLQAYLGHRNIQDTVRYTELSPARFKDFCTSSHDSSSACSAMPKLFSGNAPQSQVYASPVGHRCGTSTAPFAKWD
jgi:hypothetical protein